MSDGKPFHNPFGVLSEGQPRRPAASPAPAADAPRGRRTSEPPSTIGRAVVSFQRAGRGGKAVTVVSHLGLPPAVLEAWLKDLKAALGCGGVIEGDTLVLQGDHRTRLPNVLAARGVRRVTTAT